ncbi:HIT domain-containing protein [Verrucomicrobium spinosum]|uniref:HIT domain-containing protein n=1 Tax=Verrucomicrobium spinosum TaxID=2736 RepID=UPI001C47EBCB|nr:HIT domain-containing protein [Verrucomicrobium spinosum]
MTLFQKILAREIPATFIYEDDDCFAIKDINPQAPVHVLVIPKTVIPRVGDAVPADQALWHPPPRRWQDRHPVGSQRHRQGFRLVINHGRDAGETVPHMHVHLLAGRDLTWPPG